uniref:Uncharacterized protein n=1 Tax=Glossina austeni TaxID=7395 RepID=A0A1A9UJI5_GLOAU
MYNVQQHNCSYYHHRHDYQKRYNVVWHSVYMNFVNDTEMARQRAFYNRYTHAHTVKDILNRATLTDSYLCILWKFLTFQLDLNLLKEKSHLTEVMKICISGRLNGSYTLQIASNDKNMI